MNMVRNTLADFENFVAFVQRDHSNDIHKENRFPKELTEDWKIANRATHFLVMNENVGEFHFDVNVYAENGRIKTVVSFRYSIKDAKYDDEVRLYEYLEHWAKRNFGE